MTPDTQAATAAYIDGLGADTLTKAAAYTTGNHWLLLWSLVVSAVVTLLIVRWGVLDRVEARLARRGPEPPGLRCRDRLLPGFRGADAALVPVPAMVARD